MLLLSVLAGPLAHGSEVVIESQTGLSLHADYFATRAKPLAVLLLHDFLQTEQSPLLHVLAEGIQRQGYAALVPTLSLGLQQRRQVSACEALHVQNFEGAHAELGAWVEWLLAQGYQRIVLFGHGLGAVQTLAYAGDLPATGLSQLIMLNPLTSEQTVFSEGAWSLQQLEAAVARGDQSILMQPLFYCRAFAAPARVHLSYRQWPQQKFVDALTASRIPVRVMLVGSDQELYQGFNQLLLAKGVAAQAWRAKNLLDSDAEQKALLAKVLAAIAIDH